MCPLEIVRFARVGWVGAAVHSLAGLPSVFYCGVPAYLGSLVCSLAYRVPASSLTLSSAARRMSLVVRFD